MISDRKSTTLLDDPLPTLETAKKNCIPPKYHIQEGVFACAGNAEPCYV